jgi:hypothetical protein
MEKVGLSPFVAEASNRESLVFSQGILARFREAAGNELENIQQHVEAAECGNYVVAVLLPNADVELREKVRQSLKSHGGYNIVLGRRNSLQTLDA